MIDVNTVHFLMQRQQDGIRARAVAAALEREAAHALANSYPSATIDALIAEINLKYERLEKEARPTMHNKIPGATAG